MSHTNEYDDGNGLMERLGHGRVLELDPDRGKVIVEFRADPDMGHSGGIVQGGFVTGWLDNAMAFAAIAYAGQRQNMTTLEIKVSFFAPARVGVTMRAEGWVERSGKRIMFLEGHLTDPDGNTIAKATATGRWLSTPPSP